MSTPQIICLVIAGIGVVGIVIAFLGQRRFAAMHSARTVPVADLGTSALNGTPCEINGTAEPGSAGRLTGPMSSRPCVWFRATVQERWREHYTDSDGHRRSRTRHRTLRDDYSPPQFAVRDRTGGAVVDLRGGDVDNPIGSFRREMPAHQGGLKGFAIEFVTGKDDHRLIYTERIVPPGQHIYVLGQSGMPQPNGDIVMHKPEHGPFIVSTRTEEQLTASSKRQMLIGYIGGGVLFVGGAIGMLVVTLVM